ncbi:hypothetical protein KL86CLO1_11198 [uncultured Eubacteriales bacterium]|uniref:Uncharacterized protein n=1 Tax=uncultured Eubacteriales bacterium TaxID=172733 RepID=A0A212JJ46_9FIRM|nr:hypothetical protein KL86CLO1_11198 [uncultured Eubacteriales bacterium]
MSKYINTISLPSIERMAIVLGNGRLARQVRKDEGCDLTINLGFFEGSKPMGHLKIDGKVLSKPDWGWGTPGTTGISRWRPCCRQRQTTSAGLSF